MKSAGTVLVTYPAYWAFALPSVKDKQRSAHADMSVIPTSSKSTYMNKITYGDNADSGMWKTYP